MTRPVILLSLLIAVTTPLFAQPNLLDDPGFALATDGTLVSNSAWTLVANAPDGINSSAIFEDAGFANDPIDPGNSVGVWIRSFEGGANLGEPLAAVTLNQVVTAIAGGEYTLEFSARREVNFLAGTWTATLSSSGTGGVDQVDLLASVPNDGSWVRRSLQLVGVSPGDQLTVEVVVEDGELAGANPQSAMLDAFDLRGSTLPSAVQVPVSSRSASWLLMALFAVMGVRWIGRSSL